MGLLVTHWHCDWFVECAFQSWHDSCDSQLVNVTQGWQFWIDQNERPFRLNIRNVYWFHILEYQMFQRNLGTKVLVVKEILIPEYYLRYCEVQFMSNPWGHYYITLLLPSLLDSKINFISFHFTAKLPLYLLTCYGIGNENRRYNSWPMGFVRLCGTEKKVGVHHRKLRQLHTS